jgi:hypothetical protein
MAARSNKSNDRHHVDEHRSSYEAFRQKSIDEVPTDDKYQRLHHNVFRPPVISESQVLRSKSPPWHSSKKTTPKSTQPKWEDVVKKNVSPRIDDASSSSSSSSVQ